MSKIDRLCELREQIINAFGKNEYNVGILVNTKENYLSAIYRGHHIVCKIIDLYSFDDMYHVIFTDNFVLEPYLPQLEHCANTVSIVNSIEHRIAYYNKKKEQIESIDLDKLCSDYRIDVNVDTGAVDAMVYAYMSRGNGKTRFAMQEMFKKMQHDKYGPFAISDVIFNDPATIVFWADGTKTVVKCQNGDGFDPEKGLAMAISKKVLGNDYGYYETFAKHVGRYNKKHKEK